MVKVVRDRFVPVVFDVSQVFFETGVKGASTEFRRCLLCHWYCLFDVSQVFFETGVKGASSFADVEFGAFGAMDDVHDVVRQAVELFGQ